MESGVPSRSAMSAAVARGTHRLTDAAPWIFDDPFALVLVGPGWEDYAAESMARARLPVVRQGQAGLLVRSRFPEDRLTEGAFAQYVILGAGLDSFAWRRPDLMGPLTLFEVDHPATQTWKRERVASLGLPVHERHVFAPVDFEQQTLEDGLRATTFDWGRPTLFAWMGTTMYLTPAAIESTLRTIAKCGAGSEVALSYNVTWEFVDEMGREFLGGVMPGAERAGEPILTSFAPNEMQALLEPCGLDVVDHPTPNELYTRYCSGRTDDLRPYTLERLLAARVVAR